MDFEAATILIAVGDGVLADSLRFSLELEGFAVKLCDEYSLLSEAAANGSPRCLVLDNGVFTRMLDSSGGRLFTEFGIPVVLLVGLKNERTLARAKDAGVTKVLEQPLLGATLCDAIGAAFDECRLSHKVPRPS